MLERIKITINEKDYYGIMEKTIYGKWKMDFEDQDLIISTNTKEDTIKLAKEILTIEEEII
jgi:hypothetical protein